MTDVPAIAQADLLCTHCAGQCAFDPESGSLKCAQCGTEHYIAFDPDADPSAEQHYHPDMPHTEQPVFSGDRPYQCETCGGEVIFKGHSISERCAFCNGALVERDQGESYRPLGVIPFALNFERSKDAMRRWVSKRWAAPNDLAKQTAKGRVHGIYVPFWTFDSEEAVHYTVRYRKKSGKRTVTRTAKGFMRTAFDDLLMPASPHVTPLIRDGILHEFDPTELRPVEPAYLAGFAAEQHHQSVSEGLEHNAKDKGLLLRNRIKKHSGKSRIVHVSYITDTTGIKYRRVLLPVWILHYDYKGLPMKIATCGLHGRTYGERPFSKVKLIAMAGVLSAAAAGFGFFWGAENIY